MLNQLIIVVIPIYFVPYTHYHRCYANPFMVLRGNYCETIDNCRDNLGLNYSKVWGSIQVLYAYAYRLVNNNLTHQSGEVSLQYWYHEDTLIYVQTITS